MNAEIDDVEEMWEQVQQIAADTGILPEQVLLVLANKLQEPRRSELLETLARRCES